MMAVLQEVAVYPFLVLLFAGLFFLHLSLRSKASLVSLLAFSALILWVAMAHEILHLLLDRNVASDAPASLERFGAYSAHPTFDMISGVVIISLLAMGCISFFVSAISVPERRARRQHHRPTDGMGMDATATRRIWIGALLSFALSLGSAMGYYHLAFEGVSRLMGAIFAFAAIFGLVVGVFSIGFAIRRNNPRQIDAKETEGIS